MLVGAFIRWSPESRKADQQAARKSPPPGSQPVWCSHPAAGKNFLAPQRVRYMELSYASLRS
jgi:hypothetical protein